jgi:hypothetical protein
VPFVSFHPDSGGKVNDHGTDDQKEGNRLVNRPVRIESEASDQYPEVPVLIPEQVIHGKKHRQEYEDECETAENQVNQSLPLCIDVTTPSSSALKFPESCQSLSNVFRKAAPVFFVCNYYYKRSGIQKRLHNI